MTAALSPDLSAWLSKEAAASQLNMSVRTFERLVAEGKGPERRLRPRAKGLKPEPVFNPDDVETLRAAAAAKPAVFAATSAIAPISTSALAPTAAPDIPPALAAVLSLIDRLAQMAQRPRPEPLQAPEPLWMTIDQAAAFTGLSASLLRRLAKSGKLHAIRDRAIKFRRADLANLANPDIFGEIMGGNR